ncbi:hypothetical protein T01_12870, partial [Trichinella spiralis]
LRLTRNGSRITEILDRKRNHHYNERNISLFWESRFFFIFRPFGINFEKLFRGNL